MTYIAKYLPVEIKDWNEGYAVDTETGACIYYNGDYGEKRPDYISPAKLFMCSTDIKTGDKMMWIGPTVNNLKSFSFHTAKSSVNAPNTGWIKIIGKITNNFGIQHNQEFLEENFSVSCVNFLDKKCGCFYERNNPALSSCTDMELFVTIERFKTKKISSTRYVGIEPAEVWFKGFEIKYPILNTDVVVCSWSDYHDEEKSHIEGKTTIAIFRSLNDAEIFFNSIKYK
jgi:hypothetical protein